MQNHQAPSGHPVSETARLFKTAAGQSPGHPLWETVSPAESINRPDKKPLQNDSSRSTESLVGSLSLSPERIGAPAFFVDSHLSIRWMAPDGADPFSRSLAQQLRASSTRNVFNILLRPAIRYAVADWGAFFSFIYTTLRNSTTSTAFDKEFQFIARDRVAVPDTPAPPETGRSGGLVDSCLIVGDGESGAPPVRIFSLSLEKGTLFLIRPEHRRERIHGAEEGASVPHPQSVDSVQSMGVLSARLNNSHHLAEIMLPDRFIDLMKRIADEAEGIVRSLGGRRAACNGAQLCYVFSESAGRNPIFSAICCATRLNGQMALLEEKLKVQQGWSEAISLNMGISHGTEDRSDSDPRGTVEFVLPGGAFDLSSNLSAMAGEGEIWITKPAVAQLPKRLVDQVVMGIDHQGAFLRNFFTRLSDLQQEVRPHRNQAEVGNLSVARILKLERQGPDGPSINEG